MASAAQDGGRPPGRTALAGRNAGGSDSADGGKPGLVFAELAHLGKLNLRGGDDMVPAVGPIPAALHFQRITAS